MEISSPQFINSSIKRVFVINYLQNLIYGGNSSCNVEVYDIKRGEFLYEIDAGLSQYISCITISDCGNYLLVGTYGSGIIKLINTTTRTVIKEFKCFNHNIRCVLFGKLEMDSFGNLHGFIFSSAEDGYIKKINLTSTNVETFNINYYENDWVSCILYNSPNTIFYSTYHGDIVCQNFDTREIIYKININLNIWEIYFVNSNILASNHYIDGEIHLFNRKNLKRLHTIKNSARVSSCASPDGNHIIAKYLNMNDYSHIIIWNIGIDVGSGSGSSSILLNYNSGYSDTCNQIIISPNCKKIYTLEFSGLIREYNLYTVLKEKKDCYKLLLDGDIISCAKNEFDILFKISTTTSLYTDSKLNIIVLKNSCNDIFTIESQDYNKWIECINIIFERLQKKHSTLENPDIILNKHRFDIFQNINLLSTNILKKIVKYLF